MANEKLNNLIAYLLSERPEWNDLTIPAKESEQFRLYRSLVNIRPAEKASAEYLKAEDEFLQKLTVQKGITDIADLQPIEKNIYLWKGDITTLQCGAIVNAANSGMTGCYQPCHNCIDNCIHTYAGIQLRLACNELMQKQGHKEGTGLCKITPAFNLPSRYVLHTVGPIIYTSVGKREKILLANCYKNCLETASQNQLESVAFCCISTGVFSFPQELAARIAVEMVEQWLAENPDSSVKKVVFNVFGNKDLEIYQGLLL